METLKYFRPLKEESAARQPFDIFLKDLDSGVGKMYDCHDGKWRSGRFH